MEKRGNAGVKQRLLGGPTSCQQARHIEINCTAVQVVQAASEMGGSTQVLEQRAHGVSQEAEEQVHEIMFAFSIHDPLSVPVIEDLDVEMW